MKRRVLRVGGVGEPFTLPWVEASEFDAFAELGVEITHTNHDGGTGALPSTSTAPASPHEPVKVATSARWSVGMVSWTARPFSNRQHARWCGASVGAVR